mmetsp:Transcript_57225/g.147173  ORF Transcript_57225/g.147173 Transcript_57225/m.147173 type:complete len:302 (+) Transcript_57225:73-978(+)
MSHDAKHKPALVAVAGEGLHSAGRRKNVEWRAEHFLAQLTVTSSRLRSASLSQVTALTRGAGQGVFGGNEAARGGTCWSAGFAPRPSERPCLLPPYGRIGAVSGVLSGTGSGIAAGADSGSDAGAASGSASGAASGSALGAALGAASRAAWVAGWGVASGAPSGRTMEIVESRDTSWTDGSCPKSPMSCSMTALVRQCTITMPSALRTVTFLTPSTVRSAAFFSSKTGLGPSGAGSRRGSLYLTMMRWSAWFFGVASSACARPKAARSASSATTADVLEVIAIGPIPDVKGRVRPHLPLCA